MELNQRKEQFSKAYVRAVAAAAGFNTYEPAVDDDSVDLGLAARSGNYLVRAPRLELQLKCTAHLPLAGDETDFSFALKRKNYDDLRHGTLLVPRILVVMLVPSVEAEWVEASDDRTILRHVAYWVSLRGRQETANDVSVTIALPKTQRFTPDSVTTLMQGIQEGYSP